MLLFRVSSFRLLMAPLEDDGTSRADSLEKEWDEFFKKDNAAELEKCTPKKEQGKA